MRIFKIIFIFGLFFTFANMAAAQTPASIAGGDITYISLGNNTYRFTLTVYRDCASEMLDTTQIATITGCGIAPQTLILHSISGIGSFDPICPQIPTTCQGGTRFGITQHLYTATYTFPTTCNEWTIAVAMESRTISDNIASSANTPFYIQAKLNNTVANNSPDFVQPSIFYTCVNQPVTYYPGIIDMEGDSLVYSIVNPLFSADSSLAFQPNFNLNQPFSTASGFSISSTTGGLTFTPTVIGQKVALTINVKEYRNGVLIGTLMRNMFFVVEDCFINTAPQFSALNNVTNAVLSTQNGVDDLRACVGQPMAFSITANDVDSFQNLQVNISSGCPGSTTSITTNADGSKTLHFVWQANAATVGVHTITLQVRDNYCPVGTIFTKTITVTVPFVNAQTDVRTLCKGNNTPINLSAQAQETTNGAYVWTAFPSTNALASGANIATSLTETTVFTVTYQDNICNAQDTILVKAYGGLSLTPANITNYCPISDAPIALNAAFANPAPSNPVQCGVGNITQCTGAANNRTIGGVGLNTLAAGGVGTPYQGFWHDGRLEILFTAAELTTAGLRTGLIFGLQFNVSQKNSTAPYKNFTIKMGCTNLSNFTSTSLFTENLSTVYSNAAGVTTTIGLNNYILQTPYRWDGSSNVLIQICFDNTSFTGYDHVTMSQTAENSILYSRQDGVSGCALTLPIASKTRADIVLRNCPIVPPTVPPPYTWTVLPAANGDFNNANISNPQATVWANQTNTTVQYIVNATDGRCPFADTLTVLTSADPLCLTALSSFGESLKSGIRLSPNPSAAAFSLVFGSEQWLDATIKITDIVGKTIFVQQKSFIAANETLYIETENWAAGIYFVKIENESGKAILKMVKQ
jgi:Secretion system C-terminal sorting domain